MHPGAPVLLVCLLLAGCSESGSDDVARPAPGTTSAEASASPADRELGDDPSDATVDLDAVGTALRRTQVLAGLADVGGRRARDPDVRAFAREVAAREATRQTALEALAGAYAIDCCGTHTEAGSPLESGLRADVPRLERSDRADVDVEFLHRLLEHEALLAPTLQQEVDAGTHRPAVELGTALLADQEADAGKAGALLDRLRDPATG